MIKKLLIHKAATYGEPVEIEPTAINYFFGSNGSGKSTLAAVIARPQDHPNCKIDWQNGEIESLVYNKDFVRTSFGQSPTIKGIFTLGKSNTDAQDFIRTAKQNRDILEKEIAGLTGKILDFRDQTIEWRASVSEKAWSIKAKFESHFKEAYRGYLGSKNDFLTKCSHEFASNNSVLLDETQITKKADTLYKGDRSTFETFPVPDSVEIKALEQRTILKEKIVGKEDLKFGLLIKSLEISDWVRLGVDHLKKTGSICPFCQQEIESKLQAEIESFFDAAYERNLKELADYKAEFGEYVVRQTALCQVISNSKISILDLSIFNEKFALLKETLNSNQLRIDSKILNPSLPIELHSCVNLIEEIVQVVSNFNLELETHNKIVKNREEELKQLSSEIWKFITNELSVDLQNLRIHMSGASKGSSSIQTQISTKHQEVSNLTKQIQAKGKEVTGTEQTAGEINKILKSFGFTNFSLKPAAKDGFYTILRADGSAVNETLSEGEYTFITFLYFYHLLNGSIEDSGEVRNKIVAIDDPISSLDSNVLFVVSNLIKKVVRDVKNSQNGVRQIFILTHNVYFYKEVTFKGGREGKWREESYWIIQKISEKTSIKWHKVCPVTTAYQMLWSDISGTEFRQSVSIFNTLRRILEYYFNILGGMDYEKVINSFEGEELLICKSLVSWINDGSHYINEELMVTVDQDTVGRYLDVFKLIFQKLGHESHYNMMKKIDQTDTVS